MIGGSLFVLIGVYFGRDGGDDGLVVAMVQTDRLGYNLGHILSQSQIYAQPVVSGGFCAIRVAILSLTAGVKNTYNVTEIFTLVAIYIIN